MLLRIVSNYSKKEYTFPNLEDRNISRLNYTFDIQLPENVLDGEYAYFLYSGNEVISTGLCQIGDYIPPTEETHTYTNNNDEVIIYGG